MVPENIVIARDGYSREVVKLVGWGRATAGSNSVIEPREDLLGLARCALEALTGRAPSSVDAFDSEVPEALRLLLSRALATDDQAFASARELGAAFQTASPRARKRTQLLEASPELGAAPEGRPETMTSASSEQRRWARAPYRTPVRIQVPGIGSIDGRSEDISAGGILVVSRAGLKVGTEVTVRFALPLDGRVVAELSTITWLRATRAEESRGLSAIGVEFTSISNEALRQIERYASLMGDGSETSFAR